LINGREGKKLEEKKEDLEKKPKSQELESTCLNLLVLCF